MQCVISWNVDVRVRASLHRPRRGRHGDLAHAWIVPGPDSKILTERSLDVAVRGRRRAGARELRLDDARARHGVRLRQVGGGLEEAEGHARGCLAAGGRLAVLCLDRVRALSPDVILHADLVGRRLERPHVDTAAAGVGCDFSVVLPLDAVVHALLRETNAIGQRCVDIGARGIVVRERRGDERLRILLVGAHDEAGRHVHDGAEVPQRVVRVDDVGEAGGVHLVVGGLGIRMTRVCALDVLGTEASHTERRRGDQARGVRGDACERHAAHDGRCRFPRNQRKRRALSRSGSQRSELRGHGRRVHGAN